MALSSKVAVKEALPIMIRICSFIVGVLLSPAVSPFGGSTIGASLVEHEEMFTKRQRVKAMIKDFIRFKSLFF